MFDPELRASARFRDVLPSVDLAHAKPARGFCYTFYRIATCRLGLSSREARRHVRLFLVADPVKTASEMFVHP